jgi:hypothetical protein
LAVISSHYTQQFFSAKLTDWLLAILTFFLVLFTYRLWRSTDKLWAAGEKQIAVARDSADAAKEAADAARDQTLNFAKLERPYLYIFDARGLNIDQDQEDPFHYLNYSVANYGKTPALVESFHRSKRRCRAKGARCRRRLARFLGVAAFRYRRTTG